MAGEFTGYYIYEAAGSNRRLKGMYGTQDDADTAAALDTTLTANQGSSEFPNAIAVGWLWDTTKSEWRMEETADLSAVAQVKQAANDMLDVFDNASAFAQDHPALFSCETVDRARDAMYHQTTNAARVASDVTLPIRYRLAFVQAASLWPAGVEDVIGFFDAVRDAGRKPGLLFSWASLPSLHNVTPVRLPVSDAFDTFDGAVLGAAARALVMNSSARMNREWVKRVPV